MDHSYQSVRLIRKEWKMGVEIGHLAPFFSLSDWTPESGPYVVVPFHPKYMMPHQAEFETAFEIISLSRWVGRSSPPSHRAYGCTYRYTHRAGC